MKKTILFPMLLTACLLFAGCGKAADTPSKSPEPAEEEQLTEEPVASDVETPAADTPATMPEENSAQPETIRVYGQVKEKGEDYLYIENDNTADPYAQIKVNVTPDTLILDAATGEAKAFADIQAEETIYAHVSPAMTRSLPPMSNGAVIFCNIPADLGVPMYAKIMESEEEKDGSAGFLTDQDIIYYVNENTELVRFSDGEAAELSELKEGTHVVAWYQMVMESLPAQTYPDKILILD